MHRGSKPVDTVSSRLKLDQLIRGRLDARRSHLSGPPPITRRSERDDAPLSLAQERLWLIDRLHPDNAAYNIAGAVDIEGTLDVEALGRALDEIVRRHEILRTVFIEPIAGSESEPRQRVLPFEPAPLMAEDHQVAPEEAIRRLEHEEARRPFDLDTGPLFRRRLLRLGPERHRLLLTMHHVVSDGWSLGVLLHELSTLYAGSSLPELPVQYADYATWQRQWLSEEALERHLDSRRLALAGLEPLALPLDHPRPKRRAFRGARVELRIDASTRDRLQALASERGATLYAALAAAWAATLGRFTHQQAIALGAPSANRDRLEIEGLVGFFVNTLVLLLDLEDAPSFATLVERARDTLNAAKADRDLPFARLVEALAPDRNLATTPLVQAMLGFHDAPLEAVTAGGLRFVPSEIDTRTAKFDLDLTLTRREEGLIGALEYDAELFERASAEGLAKAFERLLSEALDAPDRPLSTLPILDAATRADVVETWNDTATPFPRRSIPELFVEIAEAHADAIALSQGEKRMSYAELSVAARRVAFGLRQCGVGPETAVALCLHRSPEMVISTLGVLMAGGYFVPLDPGYPAERLRFMLEETRPGVVLVHRDLREVLPTTLPDDARVIEIEPALSAFPESKHHAEAFEIEPVAPESLAYVMYTSGSTGQPKGVAVPHRGVIRLVRENPFLDFGPGEIFLQFAPTAFDLATLELWGPLLSGSRLEIAPAGPIALGELSATIESTGVTTLWLTAGLFHRMVEEHLPTLAGVRQLLAGGDVLSPRHVRRVLDADVEDRPADRVMINGYGPTESTTFATTHRLYDASDLGASVPIGRPIANTRVYLVDARFEPVPPRAAGELMIAGDGLARGYFNRPATTAAAFVPDPFVTASRASAGDTGGQRLYRTGDLARWRHDGTLEFLGRIDRQVKLRGYRIEPGEIEAALVEHPKVARAVVTVWPETPGAPEGEGRLAAHWVARDQDDQPAADELRAHLGERLPSPLVPAAFIVLGALPLDPNGKVDRKALPTPSWRDASHELVEPSTPTEVTLAEIWADVLGVERVGVRDDFFASGGHSLSATRVISRVRQHFGIALPLAVLFEAPSVGALARHLEAAIEAGAANHAGSGSMPPIEPIDREGLDVLPTSFAQERLVFLDRLEPGRATYSIPVLLSLRGRLDADALRRAAVELTRRHESLRTTFRARDAGEGSVQVIHECLDPEFVIEPTADTASARARIDAAARRPFDLGAGPLLRFLLLALEPSAHASGEQLLFLNVHHVVADGWSTGVMIRELAALYQAFAAGRPSPLAEMPVQIADHAVWQRRHLTGEILDRHLDAWRERLAGVPPLDLPTDHPRPARPERTGETLPVDWSPELAAGLRALAHSAGTTLFAAVLAGYGATLSRFAGSATDAATDFAVGAPVANRDQRETEGLIGCLVNTLPLRLDLSGAPSFETLLCRVRETLLDADAHRDAPFEKVVETLGVERDPSTSPIFQVVLAFQNTPAEAIQLGDLEVEHLAIDSGTAKFDLTLSLGERLNGPRAGGLEGYLEYSNERFAPATARRLLLAIERLLTAVVAEPTRAIGELPLVGPDERAELLALGRGPRVEEPIRARSIPARFLDMVARHGERTAVEVAKLGPNRTRPERVDYATLAARSEHLARHLRTLGVDLETPIALFAERSIDALTSILAILRAGGYYVPLDPSHPPERHRFVLEDSAARLLLAPADAELPAIDGMRRVDPTKLDGSEESPPEPPLPDVPADALAYVMYTSGSTGRPKGVAVPHRAVLRLVLDNPFLDFSPERAFLHLAPAAFDASTLELWGPLLHGGRLVLAPPGRLSLEALGRVLRGHAVDTLWLTAGLFHRVVEERLDDLRGVDQLLAGGDVLSLPKVREALEDRPGRLVINGYGPTESTTFTTTHGLRHAAELDDAISVPIGRPIARTHVLLVDPAGALAPRGAAGHLCVGGDGLARGYLGRPALTAERFVPDPLATSTDTAGGRLYATGDLARWRPDGTLEFLGRIDHQVKIRGFRVEPGEIENALVEHPEIAEAVVVARDAPAGDRRLVAYLVAADGESIDLDALRDALVERLPEPMRPSTFERLDSLPLGDTGKVDRPALPAPSWTEIERSFVAPQGAIETALADIFAEILGIDEVGRDDDFFLLGGHSLLATRLASAIRRRFEVELPLATIFDAPRLADLATRVTAPRDAETSDDAPALVASERPAAEEPWDTPLSFAQERLFVLDRLEPGNAAYNMPGAVRLRGRIDADALRRAMARLIERHEILRTTFHTVDGRPVQRILPPSHASLDIDSVFGVVDCDGDQAEARRRIDEDAAVPFDLSRWPLLRLRLFRIASTEALLGVNLHHVIADGWSASLLTRELGSLYHAEIHSRADSPADGARDASSTPQLQYADYALWQRQALQNERLDRQLDYWRDHLAGMPQAIELPTDRPRSAVRRFRGGRLERALSAGLGAEVDALAHRLGATPFMVFFAAFELVLSRLSGEHDFGVGTPIAGRHRSELEDMLGLFLNTLVLRADLSGAPSFAQLVARVRRAALAAFDHQDLPFERLIDELAEKRDTSRTPLFQVFFNMLNLPSTELHLPGLDVEPAIAPDSPAKFDLTVYVRHDAGGTVLDWVYDADLFDARRLEILTEQYEHVLRQALDDAERSITQFDLRSPAVRDVLPDPLAPLDGTWLGPVHDQFFERAAAMPKRPAVVDQHGSLSYGQLAARVRGLAHDLRMRTRERVDDAPRGRVVAIWAHRDATLVEAILGVLAAGAAFTILDPSYPAARLVAQARLAEPVAFLRLLAAAAVPDELSEALDALRTVSIDLADREHAAEPDAIEPAALDIEPLAPAIGADDLAYLAFTSGSTGEPKGIRGRHGPLSHFHPSLAERFDLRPGRRYAMLSGLAHDPLHRDIFTPLALGGTIHVPDPRRLFDAGYLADWMVEAAIEVTVLTPAMGQVLAEDRNHSEAKGGRRQVPSLHRIFLVGDVLTRRDVNRLERLAPNARCVNLYGSTETQRAVAFYEAPRDDDDGPARAGREILPLGRGMRDVQLLVLGADGGLAGVGEIGEIVVRSPHLAAGYLAKPEIDPFGPNPFRSGDDDPDDRIYRTGDLGRYLPSGEVVFAGRSDQQVKIRGFRIEPGEIEAHLGRLDGVGEAVVLVSGEGPKRRLIAYVTPSPDVGSPDGKASESSLRRRLHDRLPAYMVPERIVFLNRLPLTPNRKVDRRALRRIEPDRRERAVVYRAPHTDMEKTIATILQEVLEIDQVGAEDNFFDLGGTSLLLVRVHEKLQAATGQEIPAMEIFNHPTASALAAHLATTASAAGPRPTVAEGAKEDRSEALARGKDRLKRLQDRRRRR